MVSTFHVRNITGLILVWDSGFFPSRNSLHEKHENIYLLLFMYILHVILFCFVCRLRAEQNIACKSIYSIHFAIFWNKILKLLHIIITSWKSYKLCLCE